jgi:hypothetical protein
MSSHCLLCAKHKGLNLIAFSHSNEKNVAVCLLYKAEGGTSLNYASQMKNRTQGEELSSGVHSSTTS